MNVFEKDLGVHQGRIPGGAGHVYELGHALLAPANVGPGDFHEVSQEFVVDEGSALLAANVRIVTPAALPTLNTWVFSVWLNDVQMFARRLRPSKRPIVLHDLRVSLRDAVAGPATNEIRFRLELV